MKFVIYSRKPTLGRQIQSGVTVLPSDLWGRETGCIAVALIKFATNTIEASNTVQLDSEICLIPFQSLAGYLNRE